ncbi:hypothetical protein PHLGIDRAFT_44323, partial [Phlebiopsis gigantea 11061_1 CR5-6]
MPPTRTAKQNQPQASSSKAKLDAKKSHKRRPHAGQEPHAQAAPGVQKTKAALRQTRRLLAKDKLAADVRVATERRLKALEADLAQAERARKERTLATRYHKHKFIERQKVTRKVIQTKRELEACTDKKRKKKLEKALYELRVDLNYILVRQVDPRPASADVNLAAYFSQHYPKLRKYISLFPPEIRQKDDADGKSKEMEEQVNERVKTDAQREEIRQQIRSQMEREELSSQPELEERRSRKAALDFGESDTGATNKPAKSLSSKQVPKIEEDEFFGEESDHEDDE